MRTFASLIAVLFLAITPPTAGDARANADTRPRIELSYEIFYGGFLGGSVDVTVAADGGYRMASLFRSRGAIDLLLGFTAASESRGALASDRVTPLSFRSDNVWMGETRSVRSTYSGDGGIESIVVPTAADDDREPVPPSLITGTVDPLSAALSLTRAADRSCAAEVSVFDGWRLYDLRLEPAGNEDLRGGYFEGPARRCEVTLTRRGGRSRHPWLPRALRPTSAKLWFAPVVPGFPPVPVRLEAEIAFATMVVHLVASRTVGSAEGAIAAAPTR